MAKDDDKLIRIFRALTPPWPIGVAITPQMREAVNWLVQHRDERDTDAYRDIRNWLAEQMRLSPDTLAPLTSRALQIKDNPSSSSAPATSPPTEHTAEPTAAPPKAEPAPEVETAPEPESEPPSASEPITEPTVASEAEGGGESVTDAESKVESELTVEPKVGPAELTAEPGPRDELELETLATETSAAEASEPESNAAAEMDELVILNHGAEEGGLTDIVKQLAEDAAAGKEVSDVGLGLGPSKKRRKPGAGAKQKLAEKYKIELQQDLRQAIEREPGIGKHDAAIAELKQSIVPALERKYAVKLTVSNSTLYRHVIRPVLGPRRPK